MSKVTPELLVNLVGREVPGCPGVTWQTLPSFSGVIFVGRFTQFYIKGPYYSGESRTFRHNGIVEKHLMLAVHAVERNFAAAYPEIVSNALRTFGLVGKRQ